MSNGENNTKEKPLLAKASSHFPLEDREENPLLAKAGSHFPSENREDYYAKY